MSESQNIEYKQGWRDESLKWICGFANATGGKIYIGVFNSIIHNDYTGAPIQRSVYSDKLMLWNEGRLPDEFTMEMFSNNAICLTK